MNHTQIDGGSSFDWSRASEYYAKFRDIYPEEFYRRIIDSGLCRDGQKVLDLGTGTGVLPRNLYRFGAEFTGADISPAQIEQAKQLSHTAGMNIHYLTASAESIDFPPNSFDVVTACQCFIYFDQPVALPKIHAVLKDKGHFCIIWMAWLPYEDTIANASEQLILKYNPSWTGGGYTRAEMPVSEWMKPLFKLENAISYDLPVAFTRESWHGRMLACRGMGASSLPQDTISLFEEEHKAMLNAYPEHFEILHHITISDFTKI